MLELLGEQRNILPRHNCPPQAVHKLVANTSQTRNNLTESWFQCGGENSGLERTEVDSRSPSARSLPGAWRNHRIVCWTGCGGNQRRRAFTCVLAALPGKGVRKQEDRRAWGDRGGEEPGGRPLGREVGVREGAGWGQDSKRAGPPARRTTTTSCKNK